MKEFSKDEIDKYRDIFRNKGYAETEANIAGRNIKYFNLPPSLNSDLPNFVFRLTGQPHDGYVIGVSEQMDERFRPYAALEEYIEFMELGISRPNRVVESETEVLKHVPGEFKTDYVNMRLQFFRALLAEANEKPEQYLFSPSDEKEFRKNLKMLERLSNELSNL